MVLEAGCESWCHDFKVSSLNSTGRRCLYVLNIEYFSDTCPRGLSVGFSRFSKQASTKDVIYLGRLVSGDCEVVGSAACMYGLRSAMAGKGFFYSHTVKTDARQTNRFRSTEMPEQVIRVRVEAAGFPKHGPSRPQACGDGSPTFVFLIPKGCSCYGAWGAQCHSFEHWMYVVGGSGLIWPSSGCRGRGCGG